MAMIQQILAQKGSQVISIGPHARVTDAAMLMNDHKVGALVVIDQGQVVGMFTERDVLRRIVACRRDPATTTVGDVMTRKVIYCRPDAPADEARAIFKNQRIRHLPVIDDRGRLQGLISIGDLNAWELNGQEQEIYYLHEYIYGRV